MKIINIRLLLRFIFGFFSKTFYFKNKKKDFSTKKKGFYNKDPSLSLDRLDNNPILKPLTRNSWESKAVFNPAVIFADGDLHFIYRAVGDRDISVFGYAKSKNGLKMDFRSKLPIYVSGEPISFTYPYASGPSFGGCEDPRLTKIDDKFYMTYTAFNGWQPPKVALTSIAVDDFLKQRWNWQYPVIISPPGEMHKNWVIFPEKVKGKYAIMHSLSPEILIDYLDDLDFKDGVSISSHYNCKHRKNCWDKQMRGVGSPPLKTKDGWLIFYHAVDSDDPNKYKVGAMLLDLEDPTKIICRSPQPILEPDANYENEGFKAGIVYVCGAAILGGELIIYYGGADTVICGAKTNLNKFLHKLKTHQPAKLSKIQQ
jgi:beta-1,2-mannobiose phosphorylase / 1,2-beta-oligomannan phosphorylase